MQGNMYKDVHCSTINYTLETTKCLSTGSQRNKSQEMYIVEFYAAIRKNNVNMKVLICRHALVILLNKKSSLENKV